MWPELIVKQSKKARSAQNNVVLMARRFFQNFKLSCGCSRKRELADSHGVTKFKLS
jgi:hypothetical protein